MGRNQVVSVRIDPQWVCCGIPRYFGLKIIGKANHSGISLGGFLNNNSTFQNIKDRITMTVIDG